MKVSLLCPSRQRIELLKKSFASLGHGDYELLVCIDEDEPQCEEYGAFAKANKRVRLFVEPQHGYSQLHNYYNRLAEEARGDWLMLWNDDATMETEGWVGVIAAQDATKPVVLNVWHEIDNLFPVISRKFYEVIGHYSLQTHADSWVQQVGERSGSQIFIPGVKIIHLKPTDDTGIGSTHIAVSHTGPEFSSEKFQNLINQDAEKVRQWYATNNSVSSV